MDTAAYKMTTRKCMVLALLLLVLSLAVLPAAVAQSRIFRVQEGELVRLKAEARDLDKDQVVFRYSPPLDAHGEWQTELDDAGTYELTLTASDGVNEQVREITLIVENTNQPPRLTGKKVAVKETEAIDLKPLIEDPDGDALELTFKDPFDQQGMWQTDYDDAGEYTTIVKASDGEFRLAFRIAITVLNTPRELRFKNTFSESGVVYAREGETMEYWAEVEAENTAMLSYRWELGGMPLGTSPEGTYTWSFDAAGEYVLKLSVIEKENSPVGTISGWKKLFSALFTEGVSQEISREWTIRVENVNRAPELVLLPLTVREGEKIALSLPKKDDDGDALQYSFSSPLSSGGRWQTGFEDAGSYEAEVSATDGKETVTATLPITVIDADRAPVFSFPKSPARAEGKEGEIISVHLQASDPDGDRVNYTITSPLSYVQNVQDVQETGAGVSEVSGGGEVSGVSEVILQFQPGYDMVTLRPGIVKSVLQLLDLEHLLLQRKAYPVRVQACGKTQCAAREIKLVVHNVNRPPAFTMVPSITAKETETVQLEAVAEDPDGDKLRYLFGTPAHRTSGVWETDFGDQGTHSIEVTATDGKDKAKTNFSVTILKNNRVPVLKASREESTVREGEEITLHFETSDADGDNVTVWIEELPEGASFQEGVFRWTPGFDVVSSDEADDAGDAGRALFAPNREKAVWLRAAASDGEAESVLPVKLTVQQVNQGPRLLDFTPTGNIEGKVTGEITAKTNEPVLFHVAVKDDDKDMLTYEWEFGFLQGKVKGTDTVRRTFLTPGVKTVKVTASDGVESVEKEWKVRVEG